MTKSLIKIYFNNGCTTLAYNESTSVEDVIRLVIKGRLSLNELRYRHCFRLRSSRLATPFKDFNSSSQEHDSVSAIIGSKVEDYFWLRNDQTIREWIEIVEGLGEFNSLDFWKLQLRIRYISNDLNEIKFKDAITFNYYYEQVFNEYIGRVAPSLTDPEAAQVLLELGCLELRRSFQHLTPSVLEKKINFEYLENDIGLRRFFPDIVLQQKAKSLKKSIIKSLKAFESLNETECMHRFLEKLVTVWRYNQEVFHCHFNGFPVTVIVNYANGIVIKSALTKEIIQQIAFGQITQILTEPYNPEDTDNKDLLSLKIKLADLKQLVVFKIDKPYQAQNMASLIDGFHSLVTNTNKISSSNLSSMATTIWAKSSSLIHLDTSSNRPAIAGGGSSSSNLLTNQQTSSSSPHRYKNSLLSESIRCQNIAPESLVYLEILGSGQFGEVYRGTFKNNNQLMEVAIKKMKLDEEQVEREVVTKKFMHEAQIMQNFDHAHIIKLIGVCESIDEKNEFMLAIVMELAKFGQLRNYLQTNRAQLDTNTLVLYCYQLSSAMAYLQSRKFVHRDIAARNVLVVNHECVKLSDFGLSREMDENIYQSSRCKLPIKWMAPESINFRKFTSQSDVWMFGICMWEILSYGAKPYQGVKNLDVVKLVEERKVLEKPLECPSELYSIMLKCWEYDSSLRPDFYHLKERIHSILLGDTKSSGVNSDTGSAMMMLQNMPVLDTSDNRSDKIEENIKNLNLKSNQDETLPKSASFDLVLRDQTIEFIQAISKFIRLLNSNDQEPTVLDSQLKKIVNSLRDLIDAYEKHVDSSSLATTSSSSKTIVEHISDLEDSLNRMIADYQERNVESVIGAGLELARTANDLFLLMTHHIKSIHSVTV